jgi:glycosyltransferase involved in cell wall biosynthesis
MPKADSEKDVSRFPRVTVVTIVKNLLTTNRRDTFLQTMESVNAQTYKNLQYVVKDGNSTDGTLDFLRELEKSGKFQLIVSEDEGIWSALENSVNSAEGEFINFLNSDDYFCNSRTIEIAVNNLVDKKADWFFSGAYVVRKDGTRYLFPTSIWGVFQCMGIVHQTMFVRTSLVEAAMPFSKIYKTRENYFMMQLIVNKFRYVYSKEPLVCYREGGYSSVTYGGNNLEDTKRDFARYFFLLAGQFWGLTEDDCYEVFSTQMFLRGGMFSYRIISKFKIRKMRYFYLNKLFLYLKQRTFSRNKFR